MVEGEQIHTVWTNPPSVEYLNVFGTLPLDDSTMQFRIATILYFFALLAAAISVYGGWGLAAGVGVLLFWESIGRKELLGSCSGVLVSLGLILISILANPVDKARQAAQSSSCSGHLCQATLAIQNFHDATGRLPPSVGVAGLNGEEHSWRTLVLPYSSMATTYNLDEAWDGPKNSKADGGDYFVCPTHGIEGNTSYMAIVGPQTAWGDGTRRTFADITDGVEQTILLIDVGLEDIDWKEPRDLTFDEAVELLTEPIDPNTFKGHYSQPGMFCKPMYYRNVIMADRSFYRIGVPIERELAIALITASGGEDIDLEELAGLGTPDWDYGRLYGLALLIALALLPIAPAARRRIWPLRTIADSE